MTWCEVLPTIVAAAPSIAVAIVNLILLKRNSRKQITHNEKRIEIDRLTQKLEEFYYPYTILSKENTALYALFSSNYVKEDSNFTTLTSLLEKREFSRNDSAILKRIIQNDEELNKLISLKGNLVDDSKLRDLLVKSSTHYSVITMAYTGEIREETDRFNSYIHPSEVFSAVQEKMAILENRILELKRES